MELEHTFTVAASPDQAWDLLLDVERLAPCMLGATLETFDGNEFTGTVRVKLGPVTMTFAGQGRIVSRDVDARTIVLEASGMERRGGGAARASVRAVLSDDAPSASTRVDVHTDLTISGRAAQFGRGMLADVSARMLGQFTECLAAKLADRQPRAQPHPERGPRPEAGLEPGRGLQPGAQPGPESVPAAAAPVVSGAAPIDLLEVSGARAVAVRLRPYLIGFFLGCLAGYLAAVLVR